MSVLAVLAAATIWVSAPADPACALGEGVTRSLAELMPGAEVRVRAGELRGAGADTGAVASDRGGQGDREGQGDLIVRVAPREGEVDVIVSDAGGAVLLRRTLPRRGSCAETADAIALIVERYLADLGWRPDPVDVPAPPLRTASADLRASTPPPPPPPPAPGPRLGAELSARGLLALGPAQPGGAIELALTRGRLRAALEAGAFAARTEALTRPGGGSIGEARLSSLHALAGVGAAAGPVRLMLRAGGERAAASAAGAGVFQRTDQSAWQLLLRADAAYRVPLTPAVSIEPWAALELRPRPVEITVEGAAEPLAAPRLRAALGAGATWRWR